jgi:hypothetical protein
MHAVLKIAVVLLLAALPASIDLAAHHRPVVVNGQRVAADPLQDCECRARGRAWRQGEEICLSGRRAVCSMEQNVASWRMTDRTCPTTALQ